MRGPPPPIGATRALKEGYMGPNILQKLFGIGPIGAGISLILLVVAIRADRALGHPEILKYRSLMEILGALLICAGLVLHFWSMYTLRN
jgi:hypothetical protein